MSEGRKARQQRMGITLSKSEIPSTAPRSPGRKSVSMSATNTPTKIRARQLAVLQARHGASPTARRASASVAPSLSSSPPAPVTGPSQTHWLDSDVRANPVFASTPADSAMARGQLDGVASFKGLLAKGMQAGDEAEAARVKTKKTKTDKPFDPRANDDDSSSDDDNESSDDSDDDKPPSSDLASRLNKAVNKSPAASARNGISPGQHSLRTKQDEVADSDPEPESSKAKKTAIKAEPDTTSSDDDSDDETSKVEKAASTSSDSSSAAESSDSEDADDSDTDAKKAAKSLLNKPKKAAAAAAASTSSDAESSDEEVLATQEQDSDAASDKDSSDSESEDDAPAALTPSRMGSKGTKPISQMFVGMEMRRVDDSVSLKDLSTLLAKIKHKGQQAWVFSIPQATTVKVVEKLDITSETGLAAMSGSSSSKRKAKDNAAAGSSYKIVLSNRPADRQPNTPQTHVLRIQNSYDLSGIASAPPVAGLPPRKQPKGMHPRFRPLGVAPDQPMGDIGPSEDEDEDEDVEMTQAPPIAAAKKSKSEKKSKKRQDAEAEAVAAPASASKKATKRKHQADDADLASSQQAPEETSQKKAKKAKKLKPDDDATPLRKTTPILPPSVPVSSQKRRVSEADHEAATPAPKSSKKNVSFSGLAARAAKESPVPVPYAGARTAVPLPTIPSSSAPAAETPKASKKDKKKRNSDVAPSSSQTTVPTPKETPVPAPTFKASKSKK